jgi:hypothetical protein
MVHHSDFEYSPLAPSGYLNLKSVGTQDDTFYNCLFFRVGTGKNEEQIHHQNQSEINHPASLKTRMAI